jgi:primase-polymerase (primpol)-like protein
MTNSSAEMYDKERYFTVTGALLDGCPPTIEPRQLALTNLHARLFAPEKNPTRSSPLPRIALSTIVPINLSSDDVITLATNAKNADKFNLLWGGDYSQYSSQSEADLALCNLLPFWTGPNPDQIDALFRHSGLMRPK